MRTPSGVPAHSNLQPLTAIEGSPSVPQNGFPGAHRGSLTEDEARLNILRERSH